MIAAVETAAEFAMLRAIAAECSEQNPEDVNAAVAAASERMRRLPQFEVLAERLIDNAIRSMVYAARHQTNRAIKRELGVYGQPPKVVACASRAATEVSRSLYDMHIAGTTLGALLGEQIPGAINREAAARDGHSWNVELLTRLAPLVPAGRSVRESVRPKKLESIVEEITRRLGA